LPIRLQDHTMTAELANKSLRKEAGADIALLLQGCAGDVIADAGLSTQPRTAMKQAP
jgi:hypothetical protein